jgi:hypothetical protein
MFTGQNLFLMMVVVGMLSLPLALAWAVITDWLEARRLARLDAMLAVGPTRSAGASHKHA